MTHELKILPRWFKDVAQGLKNFEIRKNDRDYKVGDILILKEWDGEHYTGAFVERRVGYVYCGNGEYGVDEGYCILGVYPYNGKLKTVGEWLDAQPCEDAISSEPIKIDEWDIKGKTAELWIVKGKLQIRYQGTIHNTDLPSVTPIRPKGGWIVREDNTSFVSQIPRRWVECSHCGWSFSYDRIKDDFCSKCGADMRGKKNEGIN